MVPNNANTFLPPTITIPGFLLISNITQTYPMVVTIVDSSDNTYIEGQLVFLIVPNSYGMFQANQLTGQILAINGLDFSLDIDASQFDAFVIPGPGVTIPRPASLSPAGSRNLQYNNNTRQVGFQSLNNRGN
jgi:hypothetical protein